MSLGLSAAWCSLATPVPNVYSLSFALIRINIMSFLLDACRYISTQNNSPAPLISDETWALVVKHKDVLEKAIDFKRDFNFDFFGFKTLERSYLVRCGGVIVERPQHMLMRVALGVHGDDIDNVLKTYDLLSQGWFIHATPTLFNAGTPKPQMSSCFLLAMKDDSIDGIYETLKQTALISKSAGGIGVSIHNIRASRSYIKGTNGTSNGLIPMLRVFNDTARYVDQGGTYQFRSQKAIVAA